MKIVSIALALLMSLALVGKVFAADEEKTPGKKAPRRPGAEGMDFLRGLKLTDDQKAKVAEINKEFAPKRKELRDKMDGIFTAEQKKAREDAEKRPGMPARGEGKSLKPVEQR